MNGLRDLHRFVSMLYRGCVGKRKYRTLETAVNFAIKHKQFYYRCSFCKGYHLSSSNKHGATGVL